MKSIFVSFILIGSSLSGVSAERVQLIDMYRELNILPELNADPELSKIVNDINLFTEVAGLKKVKVVNGFELEYDAGKEIPLLVIRSKVGGSFAFVSEWRNRPMMFINLRAQAAVQNHFSTTRFPYYFDKNRDAWVLKSNALKLLNINFGEFERMIQQKNIDLGFMYFVLIHELGHVANEHRGSFGHYRCPDKLVNTRESYSKNREAEADRFLVDLIRLHKIPSDYLGSLPYKPNSGEDVIKFPTVKDRVISNVLIFFASASLNTVESFYGAIGKNSSSIKSELTTMDIPALRRTYPWLFDCGDSHFGKDMRLLPLLMALINITTGGDTLDLENFVVNYNTMRRELLEK